MGEIFFKYRSYFRRHLWKSNSTDRNEEYGNQIIIFSEDNRITKFSRILFTRYSLDSTAIELQRVIIGNQTV